VHVRLFVLFRVRKHDFQAAIQVLTNTCFLQHLSFCDELQGVSFCLIYVLLSCKQHADAIAALVTLPMPSAEEIVPHLATSWHIKGAKNYGICSTRDSIEGIGSSK
jgi:hypothetical protein